MALEGQREGVNVGKKEVSFLSLEMRRKNGRKEEEEEKLKFFRMKKKR